MKLHIVPFVMGGALLLAACGQKSASTAQPAATPKPGGVVSEVTELRARVAAIDHDQRLVTLTGPKGNTVTAKVGPEVRNLAQVKAGDDVVIRHYEAVAVAVRKSDAPPAVSEARTVERAPVGGQPSGVVVDVVEITATVETIDPATRTVTLRGPEGRTRRFKVDPRVERLNEVRPGDQVLIRYTEALAISVEKP